MFIVCCSKTVDYSINISQPPPPPKKKNCMKYSVFGRKSHGSPESVYSCSRLGELTAARWREHFSVQKSSSQYINLLLKATPHSFGLLRSKHFWPAGHTCTHARVHTQTHTQTDRFSHRFHTHPHLNLSHNVLLPQSHFPVPLIVAEMLICKGKVKARYLSPFSGHRPSFSRG